MVQQQRGHGASKQRRQQHQDADQPFDESWLPQPPPLRRPPPSASSSSMPSSHYNNSHSHRSTQRNSNIVNNDNARIQRTVSESSDLSEPSFLKDTVREMNDMFENYSWSTEVDNINSRGHMDDDSYDDDDDVQVHIHNEIEMELEEAERYFHHAQHQHQQQHQHSPTELPTIQTYQNMMRGNQWMKDSRSSSISSSPDSANNTPTRSTTDPKQDLVVAVPIHRKAAYMKDEFQTYYHATSINESTKDSIVHNTHDTNGDSNMESANDNGIAFLPSRSKSNTDDDMISENASNYEDIYDDAIEDYIMDKQHLQQSRRKLRRELDHAQAESSWHERQQRPRASSMTTNTGGIEAIAKQQASATPATRQQQTRCNRWNGDVGIQHHHDERSMSTITSPSAAASTTSPQNSSITSSVSLSDTHRETERKRRLANVILMQYHQQLGDEETGRAQHAEDSSGASSMYTSGSSSEGSRTTPEQQTAASVRWMPQLWNAGKAACAPALSNSTDHNNSSVGNSAAHHNEPAPTSTTTTTISSSQAYATNNPVRAKDAKHSKDSEPSRLEATPSESMPTSIYQMSSSTDSLVFSAMSNELSEKNSCISINPSMSPTRRCGSLLSDASNDDDSVSSAELSFLQVPFRRSSSRGTQIPPPNTAPSRGEVPTQCSKAVTVLGYRSKQKRPTSAGTKAAQSSGDPTSPTAQPAVNQDHGKHRGYAHISPPSLKGLKSYRKSKRNVSTAFPSPNDSQAMEGKRRQQQQSNNTNNSIKKNMTSSSITSTSTKNSSNNSNGQNSPPQQQTKSILKKSRYSKFKAIDAITARNTLYNSAPQQDIDLFAPSFMDDKVSSNASSSETGTDQNGCSQSSDVESGSNGSLIMIGNMDLLSTSSSTEPPIESTGRQSPDLQRRKPFKWNCRSMVKQCACVMGVISLIALIFLVYLYWDANSPSRGVAATAQAPVNDFCADAIGPISIKDGSVTYGTTLRATMEDIWQESQGMGIQTACPIRNGDNNTQSVGVWYHVEGTGNPALASVCQAGVAVEIFIFQGACDDDLTCVGSSSSLLSSSSISPSNPAMSDNCEAFAVWQTTALQPYYILVRQISPNDRGGGFALSIDPFVPNDTCERSIGPLQLNLTTTTTTSPTIADNDETIDDAAYRIESSTVGATDWEVGQSHLPTCAQNENIPTNGAWYSFAGTGGSLSLSTCHSSTDFGARISVFTDSDNSETNGSLVDNKIDSGSDSNSDAGARADFANACNDLSCVSTQFDSCPDASSGHGSITYVQTKKDVTYHIFVHGTTQFDVGDFILEIDESNMSNDQCVHAEGPLQPGMVSVSGTTVNATSDESIVPPSCGIIVDDLSLAQSEASRVSSPGVWYWVEGNGKTLSATLCNFNSADQTGSTADVRVSVYQGDSCGGLKCMAYQSAQDVCRLVVWSSIPSQRYYLHVQSPEGTEDDYRLHMGESDTGRVCRSAVDLFADDHGDVDGSDGRSGGGDTQGKVPDGASSATSGSTALSRRSFRRSVVMEGSTRSSRYYERGSFCQYHHPKSPVTWFRIVGTGGNMTASACAASDGFRPIISVLSGTCFDLGCVFGTSLNATCSDQSSSVQSLASPSSSNGEITLGGSGGDEQDLPQQWTPQAPLGEFTWNSRPGAEYFILVYGADSDTTGDFVLQVNRDVADDADVDGMRSDDDGQRGVGGGPTSDDAANNNSTDTSSDRGYLQLGQSVPLGLWITIFALFWMLLLVMIWNLCCKRRKDRADL